MKTVITVFGGASEKIPRHFQDEAYRLGREIADRGWILKNGAGRGRSCMGRTIDGALDAGGRVEGVIIGRFLELLHPRLTEVRIFRHMRDRKRDLLQTNACLVLPGGFGTLDELGEILALKQAGIPQPPVVILNLGGYYDLLLTWFEKRLAGDGFIHPHHMDLYAVVGSAPAALRKVEDLLPRGAHPIKKRRRR
jgi:uncharacterized protein (TIGR00730 family)